MLIERWHFLKQADLHKKMVGLLFKAVCNIKDLDSGDNYHIYVINPLTPGRFCDFERFFVWKQSINFL